MKNSCHSLAIVGTLLGCAHAGTFDVGFTTAGPSAKPSWVTHGVGYTMKLTRDEAIVKTTSTFRMKWLKANPHLKIVGQRVLAGKASYFLGSDPARWRTRVKRFAEVRYRAVYPGVDLIFHNRSGRSEYDWIVGAGADPSKIQIAFPDADAIHLEQNGDLVIQNDGVEMRQHRPIIYQSDRAIDGTYVLHPGNRVTFEIAAYDHRKRLIIDPVLTYSTYLGGSANDGAFGIAVDRSGNAYLSGLTQSLDFPSTPSALVAPRKPVGASTAFVAKLNATGTEVMYVAYLGGSNEDLGLAIAVDDAGSAYITGGTNSSDFPVTAGTFQRLYGGTGGGSLPPSFHPAGDAFVAKLNPAGNALVYASFLGGPGADQGYAIRVDSAGNAYVAGTTSDSLPTATGTFPITTGAFQSRRSGSLDGFVAKINPGGTALTYSTFLGGEFEDFLVGLAVDNAGNAYTTGFTVSRTFPVTAGAYQTTYSGSPAAFITKLNPTGSALVYGTYIGGSRYNAGWGIAVDSAGSAFVTGTTNSLDFPVTPGAFVTPNRSPEAAGDVFAVKVNPTGNALVYSSVFGGNGSDYGSAIALDADGAAYITGRTFSFSSAYTTIPTTANALQRCGVNDGFLTKLDASGSTLQYSSHLGGSSFSSGNAIAISGDSSVWVAGSTTSKDFPVTSGAFQRTYKGQGSDAFDADNLLPYGGDSFVTRVDITGPARLQAGCIVNGASFTMRPVSPGALVSILGGGMGPDAGVSGTVTNGVVNTSTGGTRVLFDGIPAPLLYARSDQINAVVPYGISGTTTSIQVEYNGQRSNLMSVPVVSATPAAFTANSSGVGQAAALNQDGSVNTPANPARPGSIVTLFVTGLGKTDPEGSDGRLNGAPLAKPLLSVAAYVNGLETEILYAGAAPQLVAGAFQINMRVPVNSFPSDMTPVMIVVSDTRGVIAGIQDAVTVAVR